MKKRSKEKLPKLKGYVRFFNLLYISHGWIFGALTVVLALGFTYAETLHPTAVRLFMKLQPMPRIIVNSIYMEGYSGMARLTRPDGTPIYEGRLQDGAVEGRGKLFSNGALLYDGGFLDAKFNGEGRLYGSDGVLIYEGGFLDNKYSGHGVIYGAEGETLYDGQFADGMQNGAGREYKNGDLVYEGGFVNGEYNGEGCLFSDGALFYKGAFAGGEPNGEGKKYDTSSGQLIYEGGFLDGVYSGQGREYSSGSLLYAGGFAGGVYEGEGKLYSGGLVAYDGQWLAGLYEGEGKLYDGPSLKYTGGFSAGKYNGDGLEFYPETGYPKYEGRFIDGEYMASGTRYDEKGRPISKIPPVEPFELLGRSYSELTELLKDAELEYKDMELGGSPVVLVESRGWVFRLSPDLKTKEPGLVTAAYYCGLDSVGGALVGMQKKDVDSALGAPVSDVPFTPLAPDILALTISNDFWGRSVEADGSRGVRYKTETLYITVFYDTADKSLFFAVTAIPKNI